MKVLESHVVPCCEGTTFISIHSFEQENKNLQECAGKDETQCIKKQFNIMGYSNGNYNDHKICSQKLSCMFSFELEMSKCRNEDLCCVSHSIRLRRS